MLLGILIGMVAASIFGVSLMPILIVGAILQCGAAYAVSRNPVLYRMGLAFAMIVIGQVLVIPMLLTRPDLLTMSPTTIQNVFDWLAGAASVLLISVSTVLGLLGPTGAGKKPALK